jgi:hypothetical protein
LIAAFGGVFVTGGWQLGPVGFSTLVMLTFTESTGNTTADCWNFETTEEPGA